MKHLGDSEEVGRLAAVLSVKVLQSREKLDAVSEGSSGALLGAYKAELERRGIALPAPLAEAHGQNPGLFYEGQWKDGGWYSQSDPKRRRVDGPDGTSPGLEPWYAPPGYGAGAPGYGGAPAGGLS